MKVGITVEVLKKRDLTGIEQYAFNLASELVHREELEVTLISSEKFPRSLFPEGIKIRCHNSRTVFGSGVLGSILSPPRNLSDFDLIHCPTVTSPFFFRPKSKVVMTVHDLTPILFPEWQPIRSRLYYKYFLSKRFRFVDRFIAVSNNTKRDLMANFRIPGTKIDVVYEGVSKEFKPVMETRKKFILSVSTLEPRKNLKRLIEAYVELRKEGSFNDKLILVGKKGWFYDEILTVPEQFQQDIVFKGYLPKKELIRLYQTARVFVYPSMYEGFGLPILEAMACGCPVITSNTSSMPEVAGDAGFLVNPFRTEEIKRAISTVTNDMELRTRMSTMGIRQASGFSWENTGTETCQVYMKELSG